MTTQKQLREAFWASHPDHDAHARKWRIRSARHNRHHAQTRDAFFMFVDRLNFNGKISDSLASRAKL
jgi:hypothetical protein